MQPFFLDFDNQTNYITAILVTSQQLRVTQNAELLQIVMVVSKP